MGQDVWGRGVLQWGIRLTCPAGEIHTPVASGIQHKREAAEAVVGAFCVQTLSVDAVHFILTLILICPHTRTRQCFRLPDMSSVTLSLPKQGPHGPQALLSFSPGRSQEACYLDLAQQGQVWVQQHGCPPMHSGVPTALWPSYQHTQACWSHRSILYGRSTCSLVPCSNTVRCGRTLSQISHTHPCLKEGWREGKCLRKQSHGSKVGWVLYLQKAVTASCLDH